MDRGRFHCWVSGRDPNLKTIFASFSDDLGTRANKDLQRMFDNDYYKMLFPKTKLAKRGETWLRNTNILEFAGHSGSFRNVTVEGAINGMELNLGVIDDPHKGRNEAVSKSNRDRVWNWFTDDWMARFAENSALLVIATRWHIDDLIGREGGAYAMASWYNDRDHRCGAAGDGVHLHRAFMAHAADLMDLGEGQWTRATPTPSTCSVIWWSRPSFTARKR